MAKQQAKEKLENVMVRFPDGRERQIVTGVPYRVALSMVMDLRSDRVKGFRYWIGTL